MIQGHSDNRTIDERLVDHEGVDRAVQNAVRQAMRRHMLLGESVVGRDETESGVRAFGPEEIRKILKET